LLIREGKVMPKYLIQASYTTDGLRGLQKDSGSGRRDAVAQAFQAAGGSLESMHFAFGDYDAIVIATLPDNVSAASLAITVSATGLARTRVTPLLAVEEVDAALKKTVSYRPPGR
jgi:uncharacterized protein with GYD domain